MNDPSSSLPPILPPGTAIVTLVETRRHDGRPSHPKGTAAVIVTAPSDPEHSYRVRFPAGDERSMRRQDFQVLGHFQREGYKHRPDALAEYDLYDHVIYRCVVGSRAYGLDRDGSDTDRRGIYLPPASMHWSVYGVPEQLENFDTEECYWELEKFIKLALKANPNVLEALWTPLVEHADSTAQSLRDERRIFLSKLVYQTFNGYAISQFRKIEQDLRVKGRVKWKHAMHLIRLLHAGITAVTTGELPVRVDTGRDDLLAIRDGLWRWERVDALRLRLHAEFESAFSNSSLPERPDYKRANAILISARAAMAAKEHLS